MKVNFLSAILGKAPSILLKIGKWILLHFWVIFLALFVWWLARVTAPQPDPPPPRVITRLVLDEVLKDSLIREKKYWYDKFWLTKKAYDLLFEKWKEIKPDTIVQAESLYTMPVSWEFILKIHKTTTACTVWTAKIESILVNNNMNIEGLKQQISSALGAVSEKDSSERREDSLLIQLKLYPFELSEREVILTSKAEGLFMKAKKESPFYLNFGLGLSYDWDLLASNSAPDSSLPFFPSKFGGKIFLELGYMDKFRRERLRLRPLVWDLEKGFISEIELVLWRLN